MGELSLGELRVGELSIKPVVFRQDIFSRVVASRGEVLPFEYAVSFLQNSNFLSDWRGNPLNVPCRDEL